MLGEIVASSYLPKAALIQIGSLLLLAAWLYEGFRAKSLTITKNGFIWPLAVFLVWALLSLTWSLDSWLGFSRWIHWAACGLLFFLALQIIKSRNQSRFLLCMIVASAVCLSLLGILQYLTNFNWLPQSAPPAATFFNKNMAGHFFVLVFPASLYLLLSAKNKLAMWAAAFALTCVNVIVFYTFTKAAWVCVTWECLLFLGIFEFERSRSGKSAFWGKPKAVALAVSIAITLVMSSLTPDGWKWRMDENYHYLSGMWNPESHAAEDNLQSLQQYSSTSVSSRLILYKNTLEMIAENPILGVGANNFSIHYPNTSRKLPRDGDSMILTQAFHGHNDFLQLLSELGLPFAVILCWAGFLLLKSSRNLFRRNCPAEDRYLGAAMLIALAGLTLNANFSFPLYRAIPPFLLAVYTAIFVQLTRRGDPVKAISLKLIGNQWLGAGCVFASIGLVVWSIAQYFVIKSDGHFYSMHKAIKIENYGKALAQLDKAKHYNPFRHDTLKMEGQIYLKLGRVEKARDLLSAYREFNPNYAQGLMLLGRSHQLLREFEEAETALEKGIEIDPNVARMHDLLANVKSSLGKHGAALREFRIAAKLKPENPIYQYNLGIKARSMKHFEEAVRAFKKTAQLKDSSHNAYLSLGLILFYELNDPDSGIEYMQKALDINPTINNADQLKLLIAASEFKTNEQRPQ